MRCKARLGWMTGVLLGVLLGLPLPIVTLEVELSVPVESVTSAISGLALPTVMPVETVWGALQLSVTVPIRYVCVRLAANPYLWKSMYWRGQRWYAR